MIADLTVQIPCAERESLSIPMASKDAFVIPELLAQLRVLYG